MHSSGAPIRESTGTRLLRVIILPFGILLRVAEFGRGSGPFSRKGGAEAWSRLSRNTRGILRLVLIQPARAIGWVMRRVVATFRRAVRRVVHWGLIMPRRVLRVFRHVRYHV